MSNSDSFFDKEDIIQDDVDFNDTVKTDSFFDKEDIVDKTPIKKSINNKDSMGEGEAALMGLGAGGLWGADDELSGLLGAASEKLAEFSGYYGDEKRPSFFDLYKEYRDNKRKLNKQALDEQPTSFGVGSLAGGLAGPGKFAKTYEYAKGLGSLGKIGIGAGVGATTGAVSGFASGEGDVGDRLENAKENALFGAVVGGTIPTVTSGFKSAENIASKVKTIPVIEDMLEAFKRGKLGQNLVTSKGRREASDLVAEKSGELFDDIKVLQDKVGSGIQNEIQKATQAGTKVNLTEEIKAAQKSLKEMKKYATAETESYIKGIEAEIKRLKGSKNNSLYGIPKKDLPEGIILPKDTSEILVTPERAKEFEIAMKAFRPQIGMSPLVIKPAGTARDLYKGVGEKLNEVTEGMPELKSQYKLIKDTISRLAVNEKKLPGQVKDKVTKILSKLENENLTGDEARRVISYVMKNIKKVSPEIAAKYEKTLNDVVKRLDLSQRILKGGSTFTLLGTPRAVATGSANVAGLVTESIPESLKAVGSGISKISSGVNKKTSPILNKLASHSGIKAITTTSTLTAIDKQEPHKEIQAISRGMEYSSPEELSAKASTIRSQYGDSGAKLADLIDDMAQRDLKGKKASMFHILQNPHYRKILKTVK